MLHPGTKKKQLKYKFSYFPGFSFIYKYTMNAIYIVTSSFKLLPKQKKPNVSIEKKIQRHLHLQIHYSAVVLLKKDCKHQSQGSRAPRLQSTVYFYSWKIDC